MLAVDLGALARMVVAVSRLMADNPAAAEVEVNPVIAWSGGALAVDARIVPAHRTPTAL